MDVQPDDLISLLVVVGGLLGSGATAFFVAKRARASRRRQIEASEPKSVSKSSGRVREWAQPEDEADGGADEKPSASKEAKPGRGEVLPFPTRAPEPAEEDKSALAAPDRTALKQGLARTRSGWVAKLGQILAGRKQLDPQVLEDLERVLLTADIGVKTANHLLEDLRASLSKQELTSEAALWRYLKQRTAEILTVDSVPFDTTRAKPFVLLVIGVNGTGKTTTIGKLAAKFSGEGKKVLLAAGDTFRAAAVAQLEVWGGRTGCPVVKGKEGADPSSVLFEAVKRAQTESFDVVIADTAGRLHTKTDLMAELEKLGRVLAKAMPGAPHETWLVLDSTSGQNAIAQAQIFTQAMKVSGIVLTKLDGTAKGGVILGITDQLKIPVRFIGVGERVEDLRNFDVQEFVEALYETDDNDAVLN